MKLELHLQAGVKNILSAILTGLLGNPNPSKICYPRFLKHACRRGFCSLAGRSFLYLRAKKQSGKVTLSALFMMG